MPWSWGGAAQGGVKGVAALVDLLQANQAAERQKEIDAENKRQRDLANADRDATRRRQAMIDLPGMQAAGGYVDDTVPQPTSRTPGLPAMPSVGNVARGTPERSAQVTTARRPLVLGDLLSTDANVGNDPTQSQSAIKQRALGAARAAFTTNPNPTTQAAFFNAGGTPAEADEIRAKPVAPKPEPLPEWKQKGYSSFEAYKKAEGELADVRRAPDRSVPATYTDETTGKPVQGSFDPVTKKYFDSQGHEVKAAPKQAGTSGGGNNPQNVQARLVGAVSEGRLADQRMDTFDAKHLKNGRMDFGFLTQGAAETASQPSHNPVGNMLKAAAEDYSNSNDPDVIQYFRDARLIARAEQLMSARGGSEAMASDNAMLARGGAHAPEATVKAASRSRKALFGKLGAVVQVLSPEQLQKLNAGLDALNKDDANFDYGALGKEVFGAGGVDAILPKPGAGGGRSGTVPPSPTGAPPSRAQKLWDEAVAKHGQAKVLQEYGPRPPN